MSDSGVIEVIRTLNPVEKTLILMATDPIFFNELSIKQINILIP